MKANARLKNDLIMYISIWTTSRHLLTDLQAQQQTLCNQGESGPVCGEEHQPLLLKEAGQHLRRRDIFFSHIGGCKNCDRWCTITCSSAVWLKRRKGRCKSMSMTGLSGSSLEGRTTRRGRRLKDWSREKKMRFKGRRPFSVMAGN